MGFKRRQQDRVKRHNPVAKDLRQFPPKVFRKIKAEIIEKEIREEMEQVIESNKDNN